MRTFIPLFVLFWSASAIFAASTYYVATNGSSGNTGLSTNSPWTITYALANAGASNTIMVLPGLYSGGPFHVTSSYQTIKCSPKWGAWFVNSPDIGFDIAAGVDGIVFDGLVVSNAMQDAILFWGGSHYVVRNCWVLKTGSHYLGTGQSQSGIVSEAVFDLLIEDNLIEYNGILGGFDHGIYVAGTNVVIRNNVSRYNAASGIQLYNSSQPCDKCQIYNNLVYGNSVAGPLLGISEMFFYPKGSGVNLVFNNIFVTTNAYAIQVQDGAGYFTNNIIVAGTAGFYPSGTVYGDYNLSPTTLSGHGPHDAVTNYYGFVNPSKGLYWLKADSPARGKALAGAGGPVNFFGSAQGSVTDIGAFQYKAAYASDSRFLDPSPVNPDYWANLAGTNGGSAAITVTPASQSFGSIAVGSTEDQTFTVQNIGSGTLSGSASVSAPFSIVSGGSYNLGAGLSQVVTVRYSPTTAGSDTATVAFAGGSGATASVFGTAIYPPLPPPNFRFVGQ